MAYVPRKHHTVSQCEKLYQKKKNPQKSKNKPKKHVKQDTNLHLAPDIC